jgi:RNA polymerase sigma-70 factor (ECF subfamily)
LITRFWKQNGCLTSLTERCHPIFFRILAIPLPSADLNRQSEVVNAFLTAARTGDFNALLAALDPDVVLRADAAVTPSGEAIEVHGAQRVAKMYMRPGSAQAIRPALVNGEVGLVVAPRGRLVMVIHLTFKDGKIAVVDAVADPARLRQTDLAVLDN